MPCLIHAEVSRVLSLIFLRVALLFLAVDVMCFLKLPLINLLLCILCEKFS